MVSLVEERPFGFFSAALFSVATLIILILGLIDLYDLIFKYEN